MTIRHSALVPMSQDEFLAWAAEKVPAKNFVEYTLRSNWNRPEDIADDNFVDIVEIRIDVYGNVKNYTLKTKSGNQRRDDSVRQAVAATTSIGRLPPRGFPARFDVRFDVLAATENIAQ